MSFLFRVYRFFQVHLVAPIATTFFLADSREERARLSLIDPSQRSGQAKRIKKKRIWFHAASAGELESLWTVVVESAKKHEVVITVFSGSGYTSLQRLEREVKEGHLIYSGFSPWEGHWGEYLKKFEVDLFVTAKYEAWPELWVSLSEQEIGLLIVGARLRGSLSTAKLLTRLFGKALPEMSFAIFDSNDSKELQVAFPEAKISQAQDPRWDRARARAKKGHPRAKELLRRYSKFPKPWGILAQVWPEDFSKVWTEEVLESLRQAKKGPKTIWVVPHELDEVRVSKVAKKSQAQIITSQNYNPDIADSMNIILVDERGFLTELYGSVDWAYVGGGFNKGVHNTIEPAIHGIPVSCGPKNAERFAEIALLKKSKQLDIVSSPKDAFKWFKKTRGAKAFRMPRPSSKTATAEVCAKISVLLN